MLMNFFFFFLAFWGALESIECSKFSKQRLTNCYSPHFLRLSQIAYGDEEIISQGGRPSVDVMFNGFDLNGKKCLDVGSGFGGVAIYLAEKFDVEIIGVDREPYMKEISQIYAERDKDHLKGKVAFQTLKDVTSLSEFADHTFDLVYSKEVFYHVSYEKKQRYMDEIFRVLKPGGNVIIADWFQSSPVRGERLKLASTVDELCNYSTLSAFQEILEKAAFQSISYSDQSAEHIRYTKEEIGRLENSSKIICQDLGEDAYSASLFYKWGLWLDAQVHGELLSGIFTATK